MCLIWCEVSQVRNRFNLILGRTYSDSSIYYRLLVLCLLENNGVLQLAREFGGSSKLERVTDVQIKMDVSMVAQIVASIPDKARMNSMASLSSQ